MKSTLRLEALAVRRDARAAAGNAAGHAIAENFLRAVPWTTDQVIAGYWPIGDEADVCPLLIGLHALEGATALPVVAERDAPLVFRRWSAGDALEAGPHGTRHPLAAAPAVTPAIVLVPLLAFDRAGRRLGFGGGYYDRTLAMLRASGAVSAVGIAYAAQELPEIPAEPHDQPLDWVVTERDVWRCAR